ncbi:hypothetical protein D3Z38_11375 [Clostridiales bacterium]|nr:hypothetical protein [Clostridiales bacterium]
MSPRRCDDDVYHIVSPLFFENFLYDPDHSLCLPTAFSLYSISFFPSLDNEKKSWNVIGSWIMRKIEIEESKLCLMKKKKCDDF